MPKSVVELAKERERTIARFTNIDKERFTHAYEGIKISVDVGASYLGRLPEVEHLANHLARKMISRQKKAAGLSKDPKGTQLYTDAEVKELIDQIVEIIGQQGDDTASAEEKRKQDLEKINKDFGPKKEPAPAPEPSEVTKDKVIESLKQRGIEPDVNLSREELLQQLIEAEKQQS